MHYYFFNRSFLILILAISLLFQSCGAYHKESVTLDTAALQSKKVKIQTKKGQTYKLRKIFKEGNTYYGIKKFGNKIILKENQIEKVRLFNTKKAIILNVLFVGTIALNVLLVMLIQDIARGVAGLSSP